MELFVIFAIVLVLVWTIIHIMAGAAEKKRAERKKLLAEIEKISEAVCVIKKPVAKKKKK